MRIASLSTPSGDRCLIGSLADGWHLLLEGEGDARILLAWDREELMHRCRSGARVNVDDGAMRAPLAPRTILAAGLNYADHAREVGMALPAEPLIFSKLTSSVIGPGEAIRFDPAITDRVDWEVELAVIIGRRTAGVGVEDALDHVFGYSVANDVSARDLQFGDGQWTRGKGLDTFCPLGPWIVTADEIPNPQALALSTRVNGETVQDSNTSEMVFGVSELIAYCSRFFTLEPGDTILTGTPWGCGEFMDPKRSLHHGDEVTVEVEGIGRLTNPVHTGHGASDT